MGRSRSLVHGEIKDTADAFYRALSSKNLKTIASIWAHEPYAAVAGPVGGMHQGWNQVAAYWEHRFRDLDGTRVSAKLTGMVCHAVGDVAWLSGTERRTLTRGDEVWQEELRVTIVLERKGTHWELVSYHASAPSEAVPVLASAS
jgi:ketosteroid isomerase-like protein